MRATDLDLHQVESALGRDAEVRKAVAQLLEIEPDFRISEYLARSGQWQAQMFIDGLRKAGLPE
jgi:adenylate cyclase